MASKDVLDQIRDLQSFIDDFAADAGSPTMVSPEQALATPLTRHTILQKPDEKTESEEPTFIQEKTEEEPIVEEKTAEEEVIPQEKEEEKTLVEAPLSILSYKLNLSDDFSSLLTQFKEIKVSPTLPTRTIFRTEDEEKIQVEVMPPPIENYTSPTPKFSDSFFLNDQLPNTGSSSKSHSRRTSISSKKSQRSAKSARRQNEKKLQHKQQLQQGKLHQPQKYVERSYDEMMRIPDIYERVAFYEKTLDLCLKAESPIPAWCKANREKGKPEPMLEGYVPPARFVSPEVPLSENTFGSMSGSFSGSISMFLKKAGGAQSSTRRMDNKSLLASSSNYYTPHTPSNYHSGSGLFGKSLSKLSLSRSTQIPRYDHQLQQIRTPAAIRLTTMNQRASSPTPRKKKSSVDAMNKTLSPLCTNYGKDVSSPIRTPRSSSSTPSSFGSTTTINSQGEFTSQSTALNYMINVLPQIDLVLLQNALDEAKGDPMVAISIAVSQSKLENHHQQSHKKVSSRHYNKR
ncbi:uncharacterized protein EV154DRAFT_522788 [Mucor mucedo]|uniref:uncharacterized protein n=1 Tax=Mucor mucedo TaxID=29922 RepID=UPI00221ECFB4|nr:uncharacterized protein EV154DRAFT_522788 [Mucor mucedo]KAI7882787.1 hypothetical protein EV154DRAFT_522788 [Mucor mucedo]